MWESSVQAAIEKLVKTKAERKIAVFDADGTLWREDIGEEFFKFQIAQGSAPGLKGIKDPWGDYLAMEKKNAPQAYGWLAQINAGRDQTGLRFEAKKFYHNHFTGAPHPTLIGLINQLKATGFEIWICSASIRWPLEPAAEELGIPLERLIATEVSVDGQDHLTGQLILPVPYAAGKKEWLKLRIKSAPLLVAGNSSGDTDMLEMAQSLPLVILFEPHREETRASAEKLLKVAQEKGWPRQVFR